MNRRLGSLSLAVVLVVSLLGNEIARAQQAPPGPDPWLAQPPTAPQPNGYSPAYGFDQRAVWMYQNEHKNEGIALLLNFLFMGAGSIYADHIAGALLAWAMALGGVGLIVWGVGPNRSTGEQELGLGGGLVL